MTIYAEDFYGENLIKRDIYNVVLIHVSRTWERLRLLQPNEEMPLDNIASTDAIMDVADDVRNDDHVQTFILYSNLGDRRADDYFSKETGQLSDTYIETLAETHIKTYIL